MKAAVLEHYGAPQEFRSKDLATPTLQEGQVLVRNQVSSVNPLDVLVRQGTLRVVLDLTGEPVLGSDFCGTVTKSLSPRFQSGDEVFGFVAAPTSRAYAELVAADADLAALKPTLSFVEAGVLVTTKPAMDDVAHTVDLLKPRMKMVHAKSNPNDLLKIKAWVEQGKLRSCVTQTFPLADIAQAHAQLEHGDMVGKVAIDLG